MVDVVINVFGKPWQTVCTLKSLLKWSGESIDKIYLIEEKKQPYNEKISFIKAEIKNLIIYKPRKYNFIISKGNFNKTKHRYNIRYQYGIEESDKKYVFITHNDVLYTGNIIGNMLSLVAHNMGIGPIGQCWNCPAFSAKVCNGDIFQQFNPAYEEALEIVKKYPSPRTTVNNIDINKPMPFPECRLNEWSCLINREYVMKECIPYGNSPLFGLYDGIDLGCGWFKSMINKGYKFKNYQEDFIHGYWANNAGYPTQLNEEAYKAAEEAARVYYIENFT